MRLVVWLLIAAAVVGGCEPAPRAAAPPAQVPRDDGHEAQWKALADAARAEGKVVVKGNPNQALRTDLPRLFQERFDIEIEYIGTTSSEFAVRVEKERSAGIYSTDVVLGGAAVMYPTIYGSGWLDPLRPVLTHPDPLDASKWPNGRLSFMDPEEQYILRLANYVNPSVFVNPSLVKATDIRSWYDLLKPEFRGKLATHDPEAQGAGHLIATVVYYKLGEEFFRKLYVDQRPVVVRDQRQMADALARGVYSIALGIGQEQYQALKDESLPIDIVRDLPETGGLTSGGAGMMGLLNNAPHPNAARLFVNWLASRDGMEIYTRAADEVPVRLDIDRSTFPEHLVPVPGKEYLDTYEWDFAVNQRLPLSARVRELLR